MIRFFRLTAACSAIFCATIPVWAQLDAVPTPYPSISATGTHVVKRLPQTVRVIITLQSKGKTFDEALATLNSEQKSALDKLQKLGVDKERVVFGSFGVDQLQENKRRQMEMMIAQRMRQPNQKKPIAAESIALKCTVSVEWPLVGTTAEEIFKESQALKQKIKAADFTPKAGTPTPEEEEMMEEMEGMHMYSGEGQPDGQPQFVYVAKISQEDAQEGYAEALRKAVRQSEVLAKAAGVTAPGLMNLSGSLGKQQGNMNRSFSSGEDYYFIQMMNNQQSGVDGTDDLECLARDPDSVDFTFVIHAVFAMQ